MVKCDIFEAKYLSNMNRLNQHMKIAKAFLIKGSFSILGTSSTTTTLWGC